MNRDLTAIVAGYLSAMEFADAPEGFDCFGVHPATEQAAEEDCRDFWVLVERSGIDSEDWDDESFGADFWYTRQGHGTGFWDRGFKTGAELSKCAKTYDSLNCYLEEGTGLLIAE